jgi:hypothetical protein
LRLQCRLLRAPSWFEAKASDGRKLTQTSARVVVSCRVFFAIVLPGGGGRAAVDPGAQITLPGAAMGPSS